MCAGLIEKREIPINMIFFYFSCVREIVFQKPHVHLLP